MSNQYLQMGLYLVILVAIAIPLGIYISKVMDGERVFLTKMVTPFENFIYRLLRIDRYEEMGWKQYAKAVIFFSLFGFIIVFLLNLLQGRLPLNPEGVSGTSWHLGFNTAASFATNTNWQSYSGESQLSYLTQMVGLTVQNFVSAAAGISVLYVLVRAFQRTRERKIGNFWVDMVRSTLYILLPLSIVLCIGIASQGVVQNFSSYDEVELLEPVTTDSGETVTKAVVPQGPAASQIAIKQLGTNGGGFMGANSAHPLENPTSFSNLLEMLSLLLIPMALCFAFGRSIGDKRQGIAIFAAMLVILVIAMGAIGAFEMQATPQMLQDGSNTTAAVGNMEGKEARLGVGTSATWAAWTTAAANGSVNSMHNSYTPAGGMIAMLQMQLGEVVFGGVGCGLYGMMAFAIITVFIAGLMVGRTPEYLGKKIEPYEMKMAMLASLATPVAILIGAGIACLVPSVAASLNNAGIHGFSEVLYGFTSAGGNNGSAFGGLNTNVPFLNTIMGVVMIFARFLPMLAVIAISGSLVQKKKVAESPGTLPTHSPLFVGLLIIVVLLIGALSFFPALSLGPLAEHFQMIG